MCRVFTNGQGDLGSIPGRVIPKTLKIVLDTSSLNTQQYKVHSRVKWSNPGKRVAPSPTPWCSSYWKGNLLVALDYGRQLYFTFKQSARDVISVFSFIIFLLVSFFLGGVNFSFTFHLTLASHLSKKLAAWFYSISTLVGLFAILFCESNYMIFSSYSYLIIKFANSDHYYQDMPTAQISLTLFPIIHSYQHSWQVL